MWYSYHVTHIPILKLKEPSFTKVLRKIQMITIHKYLKSALLALGQDAGRMKCNFIGSKSPRDQKFAECS